MKALLEKMKEIHARDKNHKTMNCAMIDCEINIVNIGKLVRFRKNFECFSYSDSLNGLSGLMMDKKHKMLFHFTAHRNFIMIYPCRNDTYNPQGFIDFFEHIKKTIDKKARLFTYEEYQKVKKKEQKDYEEYKKELEKREKK